MNSKFSLELFFWNFKNSYLKRGQLNLGGPSMISLFSCGLVDRLWIMNRGSVHQFHEKKKCRKKECIQIEKKECKFVSLRIWNEKRDRIYKKIVNSIILENGENFYLIALSKQLANISTFLKILVHNSLLVHIHIRCSFFLLLRQH